MTLFKPDAEGQSDAYRNLRDADWNAPLRAFAEQLWERFRPYAEPAFKDEPDFKIQTRDRLIWIEATVPKAGTGADAVPDYASGKAEQVPVEKILLRLRSAIEGKYRNLLRYQEKKIVSADDCVVVAVNGGLIPHSILETDPPRILSALFPLGDRFVTIDRSTVEIVDTGFRYRGRLIKQSGSEVRTTLFASGDYAYLSAVLYSNSDAGNHPAEVANIGSDFTIIHNPFAKNPIPCGVLPSGRDYVVENEYLVCRTPPAQRSE